MTLKLLSISGGDYDAVFYPGGHGPLWDLAEDRDSIALAHSGHKDTSFWGIAALLSAVLR
jgi:hypothetical protein